MTALPASIRALAERAHLSTDDVALLYLVADRLETGERASGTVMRVTGEKVAFLDIHIGSPFFAHEALWVRTDFDAATKLRSTPTNREIPPSCCNFLIDGNARPVRGPYSHAGETCELVGVVEIQAKGL